MTRPPEAALPPRVRRGYALGSVATGTFGTVPGLLLLPYLTDTLGIAAAAAGVIVFAPKAWDVVLNPVAGRVSDRSDSPRGRRRPFLLRAGLALAVCFALLFAGPGGPAWVSGTYVVVLFVACATAYAFFQVPYVAMPAEITEDPHERTRLMSWRVAVLALTILVSGAAAPAIRDAVGGRDGYRAMGVFVALLLVVGAVGAYRGTRDAPTRAVRTATGGIRDQLRLVGRVPAFRVLLGTFVVQALAVGSMLAAVDYVARNLLGGSGASSALFACFVGPALLVTPLWERFARRLGKKSGYAVASVLLALGALGLLSAGGGPVVVVYAAAVVAGIGYAGAQVFPLAMLPDIAAVDARRTGENRAGVFTGVWTAGETLGLALGPALYAAILALGGYVSSSGPAPGAVTGSVTEQPPGALTAIAWGFSVVPAVLVAVSLVVLRGYRLDSGLTPPPTRPEEPHAA